MRRSLPRGIMRRVRRRSRLPQWRHLQGQYLSPLRKKSGLHRRKNLLRREYLRRVRVRQPVLEWRNMCPVKNELFSSKIITVFFLADNAKNASTTTAARTKIKSAMTESASTAATMETAPIRLQSVERRTTLAWTTLCVLV